MRAYYFKFPAAGGFSDCSRDNLLLKSFVGSPVANGHIASVATTVYLNLIDLEEGRE